MFASNTHITDLEATVGYTGDRFDGENLLEFRLLYSGRVLGASKNDTRAEMKHALRREFHPQLRQLWGSNRNLDQYARHHTRPWMIKNPDQVGIAQATFTNEQWRQIGIGCISENWQRGKYNFVPLVTEELGLRCRLDILFLRPESPQYVMKGGDLDARVKTIFDALRIPANLDETGASDPQEDETPFFCLLSDDKLISSLSVTCDDLLVLPKERNVNPNDTFLVVHVQLSMISRSSSTTLSYLFD